MSTLQPDGGGDCYVVAAEVVVEGTGDMVLCHGTALGTGGDALGIWFGHAWVEVDILGERFVIDKSNGNDHFGPAATYYAAGNLRDVRRYSKARACGLLLSTQHYGPWPAEAGDA